MTYCNNCGAQCGDEVRFCPNCGSPTSPSPAAPNHPGFTEPAAPPPAPDPTPVIADPPVYQQPTYQQQPPYQQPAPPVYQQPAGGVTPANCLTWGILGLAFACTFFLSFLGIIFSIIAKNKVNAYAGPNSGQVNTGRGLAKAGLIVGIVLTVLFVIYIIFIVGMVGYILTF